MLSEFLVFYHAPDIGANIFEDFRIFSQIFFGCFATNAEFHIAIRVAGSSFFDHVFEHCSVEQITGERDAFVVHDVELSGLERWRDFVFHDFCFDAVANDLVVELDLRGTADFNADRRIELQSIAAGRNFWVAEDHADL